ncbi:MAG: LXG domain-containing protein [Lachnospiraceae bacterium]|jgi:hypothetical protein|nr:LXG domain-containing protein [Lachnospiraceae bacterium]
MGFKVNEKELRDKAYSFRYEKLKRVKDQLDYARGNFNFIIEDNNLTGKVGEAIADNINNNHCAIIVAIKDLYELIADDMDDEINRFVENVKENTEKAIIKEDTLIGLQQKIVKFQKNNNEYEKAFNKIYSTLSEIDVELDTSSKHVNKKLAEASDYLKKIMDRVHTYESTCKKKKVKNGLEKLNREIGKLSKMSSLSYSDPKFATYAAEASFAKGIKKQDYKVKFDNYIDLYNGGMDFTIDVLKDLEIGSIVPAYPGANFVDFLNTMFQDYGKTGNSGTATSHAGWNFSWVAAGEGIKQIAIKRGVKAGLEETAVLAGPAGAIVAIAGAIGSNLYNHNPVVKHNVDKVGESINKGRELNYKYQQIMGFWGRTRC